MNENYDFSIISGLQVGFRLVGLRDRGEGRVEWMMLF
jgi:hypothetical protein